MKDGKLKSETPKADPEVLNLVEQLSEQVLRLRAVVLTGAQDRETPMISQVQLLRMLPAVSARTLGRWRALGIIGGAAVPGRQGIWYTPQELQEIKSRLKAGRTRQLKKTVAK
jgi:hypothetical protein